MWWKRIPSGWCSSRSISCFPEAVERAVYVCQLARVQRGQLRAGELFADDRPQLRGLPFIVREQIETGSEDGFHGRRDPQLADVPVQPPGTVTVDEKPVVDQHRQRLLDDKRIPLGDRHHALRDLIGRVTPPDQLVDQRA